MFGKVSDYVRGKRDKRKVGSSSPQRPSSPHAMDSSPSSVGFEHCDLSASDTGFEVMDGSMQEKLSRGVRYNMKILVRGERGCGKTTLLRRLQGKPFEREYTKTPQLHAATIHWRSRQSHTAPSDAEAETIKLEVWDVVDQGFATQAMKTRHEQLCKKIAASSSTSLASHLPDLLVSDASTIDVYRGVHAVVLMVDATRAGDLDYLRSELLSFPKNICLLICRNKCDADDVAITEEDIHRLLQEIPTVSTTPHTLKSASGQVHKLDTELTIKATVISTSMENCYGLKQMYNYFNVPFEFLRLQLLEDELKQKWQELHAMRDSVVEESAETYEDFCKWLGSEPQQREPEPEDGSGEGGGDSPEEEHREETFGTNIQRKISAKLKRKAAKEKDTNASLKTHEPAVRRDSLNIEKYTGGSFNDVDSSVKGFFDDVSQSDDDDTARDEGAKAKKQAPPADIDSDDMTAAQLAYREKHTKKKKKKQKSSKRVHSDSDSDSDSSAGSDSDVSRTPSPTPSEVEAKEAAAAAALLAKEMRKAEQEEQRRQEKEAAKQERKRVASEEKRAREEKESERRRENERAEDEWREREEREKEEIAREKDRIRDELAALADEVVGDGDQDFYSDGDGDADADGDVQAPAPDSTPTDVDSDTPPSNPVQSEATRPTPADEDDGFIRVSNRHKVVTTDEDAEEDIAQPVDYGLPHVMDVPEVEETPEVSSDALKALELAMLSLAADTPDAAKPVKEKREKKEKKEKKDKKDKKGRVDEPEKEAKKEKKEKKDKKDKKEKKKKADKAESEEE